MLFCIKSTGNKDYSSESIKTPGQNSIYNFKGNKKQNMDTKIVKIGQPCESAGAPFMDAEDCAKEAGKLLWQGKIVAFPTDTVYGLGAVYKNSAAVRKIFEAKGRPENKPISILVSDIEQVKELSPEITEDAVKLMKQFWPGALTIILKKSGTVPDEVSAGGDTIGIRMPDNEFTRMVIRNAGAPLAAPSANLSGKRSGATGEQVIEDLKGLVDMIIDAGACSIGISSTVLDLTGPEVKILREGTVSKEDIEKCINKKIN